jgi:outer membrane protein assembly factor BamB
MRWCLTLAACLVCLSGVLRGEDWNQFRGPTGEGVSAAKRLPTEWGGFGPPAWQTPLPGRGWSSPITIGSRIWLTAAEQLSLPTKARDEKLAKSPAGGLDFQAHASVSLLAVELDAESGEILKQLELLTVEDPAAIHATNSYASPTPATDGERVYCHFGSLGTVCIAAQTGEIVWKRRFEFDEITGPGGSPVLVGERLILACDGADQQFVVALDKRRGEIVWQTPRPAIVAADDKLKRAFSTPLLISHDGREQLVVPGAQWVASYDPASGKELWRANYGEGHATVPRPVYRDGLVYICTGFMKPQLWAIRVDGAGDVTETHVAWKYDKQVPEISSPILAGEQIYFVSSKGILTSLDAATGALVWQERLGGNYSASPLLAGGKLYFTSEAGLTTVIEAANEYREVSRNQVFGRTLASLAVCGDALLIRTDPVLYCVRKE